jgi:hypothetical protein
MYLVICKSKVTGLSIDAIGISKADMEATAEALNKDTRFGTYHVRKFNLATIDLDKLMEEGK